MKRVAILASLLLLYPAAAGWAQITGVYGGGISPTHVTSAPGG